MTFILATTYKKTLPVDLLTGMGIVPAAEGEETLLVAEAVCVDEALSRHITGYSPWTARTEEHTARLHRSNTF